MHNDEDASLSSDDDDVNCGGDDDDEKRRLIEEYSPSKNGNGQTIAVRETSATSSCAERKESALIKEFLHVLKEVFDKDSYLLVSNKLRKVQVVF